MIERVKRWLAGCGVDHESRVGKPERPHTRRPRNLYVFFLFAFCLSIVVSDRAKKKQNMQHESCMKVVQNSAKNRSEIDEKSTRIDEKSMKFRFWAVWAFGGGSRTHGDALGTASERQVGPSWPPSSPSWPPSWRSGAPCWPSQAPSWLSWAAAGPLSSALPVQTLPRTAFEASFRPMLGRSRQARSLKFVRPRSVS